MIRDKHLIQASFEIVTPMYLGDARQHATSLRPPAIKGALRFWWRALNWGRFAQRYPDSNSEALRALHKRESNLFGAADQAIGQARFLLRISNEKLKRCNPGSQTSPEEGYLLGQALAVYNRQEKALLTARSSFTSGSFDVSLLVRRTQHESTPSRLDIEEIEDALLVFGLLGGLGARTRRGCGSVALRSLKTTAGKNAPQERELPATLVAYREALSELAQRYRFDATPFPPFTAFSSRTRVKCSVIAGSATSVLKKIGREMILERSYGRNGKVLGQTAVPNYRADHDLLLNAINGRSPQQHPERVIFGLPQGYFFSSTNGKMTVQPKNTKGTGQRRSSPLMVHVHPLNEGHAGILCLMPANFLPNNAKIAFNQGKYEKYAVPCVIGEDQGWRPVARFLDRFDDKRGIILPAGRRT